MKIVTAFVLSAVLALPVMAMGPGDGSHMLKGMTRHLDLSEAQQTQVQAIFDAKKPQMDAIREQMKALKAETDGQIKAILTPDQLVKFEEMQEKRKARMEERREHHKDKRKGHHDM